MGSFNVTCFVSKQTIAPGNPCKVLPIRQQGSDRLVQLEDGNTVYGVASSRCYPSSFWRPVGPYLDAIYDDYGQFELIDSKINRLRLQLFLKAAVSNTPSVLQGDNHFHEPAYNLKAFIEKETPGVLDKDLADDSFFEDAAQCWDYLFEIASEERLFWLNHFSRVYRPASFAVMHLAAYTELVDMVSRQTTWNHESMKLRAVFERSLAPANEVRNSISKSLFNYGFMSEFRHFGNFEGSGSYAGEADALDQSLNLYLEDQLTEDQLFEEIKPWLEARYAMEGLLMLNLRFEPLVTAGQDYSNEVGQTYRKFVDKIADQVSELQNK